MLTKGFVDSLTAVGGVVDNTDDVELVSLLYPPRISDSKNFGILITTEIRTTGATYLTKRRLKQIMIKN